MTGIEFDVSQSSLHAVLKDWELKAMQVVWGSPQGANSRAVWLRVNEMLGGGSISRASIINFLEEMRGWVSWAGRRGRGRVATTGSTSPRWTSRGSSGS